jgi:hypothetical protein
VLRNAVEGTAKPNEQTDCDNGPKDKLSDSGHAFAYLDTTAYRTGRATFRFTRFHALAVPLSIRETRPVKVVWLAPSLVELASDKGTIGEILRQVPDYLLREGDRRAEQNHAARHKHQESGRLPWPDPWQFLIDLPGTSEDGRKVFRAAQSQLAAMQRLSHMAIGVGNWYSEALNARARGDKRAHDYAAAKLGNALVQYDPVLRDVRKHGENNPAFLASLKQWQKRRRAQLVHRGQGKEWEQPKSFPKWNEIRSRFPIEAMLAESWVRFGVDGVPGLMFWRNEPLTKLLLAFRQRKRNDFCERGREFIKKVRQRLHLVPVETKAHFIWDAEINRRTDGIWEVETKQRNGCVTRGIVKLIPPESPQGG